MQTAKILSKTMLTDEMLELKLETSKIKNSFKKKGLPINGPNKNTNHQNSTHSLGSGCLSIILD